MRRVAIVGTGPTGLYTLLELVRRREPMAVTLYERGARAGVGMPYCAQHGTELMLANITSLEIPPVTCGYVDWLRGQDAGLLARYGLTAEALDERQFLPRRLLGAYFRDQFLAVLDLAGQRGFRVRLHENCAVTDLELLPTSVRLWADGHASPSIYDAVVVATGHVWPEDAGPTRFASPWSGLLAASVPAGRVGILGTSLSAIDAMLAVVAQHGHFEGEGARMRFMRAPGSDGLQVTLMSRTGLLPEADFYYPMPYAPLLVATPAAVAAVIAEGPAGLLDRLFALLAAEIRHADPSWARRIALAALDADRFADAYFADRLRRDPFAWAARNLREAERNRRSRTTVAWRYAILRLHEALQPAVAHFTPRDRARFDAGLRRVFVDNYAAIPPQSMRRLLALRRAGVLAIRALGDDYRLQVDGRRMRVAARGGEQVFDVFVDARGQRAMTLTELPFARLRRQVLAAGGHLEQGCWLAVPGLPAGRVALAALPYLLRDQPFVQGITACAALAADVASRLTETQGDAAGRRGWRRSRRRGQEGRQVSPVMVGVTGFEPTTSTSRT